MDPTLMQQRSLTRPSPAPTVEVRSFVQPKALGTDQITQTTSDSVCSIEKCGSKGVGLLSTRTSLDSLSLRGFNWTSKNSGQHKSNKSDHESHEQFSTYHLHDHSSISSHFIQFTASES